MTPTMETEAPERPVLERELELPTGVPEAGAGERETIGVSPLPPVVPRSRYTRLRTLLAIALIALIGLTVAVVILATNDDGGAGVGTATPVTTLSTGTTRYDGGPEEGTRGPWFTPNTPSATRYDGGPEEGTRGPLGTLTSPSGIRYDGGPEEGTRGPA